MADLIEKDQQILSDILKKESDQGTFKWSLEIQQQILGMICCDKYFTIQSLTILKPYYFEEKPHEIICDIVFTYFRKYSQLPSEAILLQELEDRLKDNKSKAYYFAELDTILATYEPSLNIRDYLLDRLTNFTKTQAFKKAMSESFEILLKGGDPDKNWTKVYNLVMDSFKIERNLDLGLNYFETVESRYERLKNVEVNKEVFTSGFNYIDIALQNGGLARGEIAAWMGSPGVGKSVALVTGAVKNLYRGKKVLYVSLEMDADRLSQRFDSQIARVHINELLNEEDKVIAGIAESVNEFQDKDRLKIKNFPAGTADINTIRSYIAQLNLHGFQPDMLFLDYIGEMKDVAGVALWESRERTIRDLRGFGQENRHCTITAIQPNRSARQAQEIGVIDDENMGDSSGQLRPLDALWTLNQRKEEREVSLGRIFISKHRNGSSRKEFFVRFNYKFLTIEEISPEEYTNELSKLSAEAMENIANNMMNSKYNSKNKEKRK